MTPNTPSQHSGAALDGVTLQELDPFNEPAAKTKQPAEATAAEDTMAIANALRELPFATCASSDDEQTPIRRSSRIRQPSVRLRDPDDPKTHRRRPGRGESRKHTQTTDAGTCRRTAARTSITMSPKKNGTDSSTNKPTIAFFSAAAKIDDILLAGGEVTSSSTTAKVPPERRIRRLGREGIRRFRPRGGHQNSPFRG